MSWRWISGNACARFCYVYVSRLLLQCSLWRGAEGLLRSYKCWVPCRRPCGQWHTKVWSRPDVTHARWAALAGCTPERVTYKMGVMMYRCLHSQALQYLAEHLTTASDVASRLRLRSANRHHNSLSTQHIRRPMVFSIAGPTVWNSLPDELRDPACGSDSFMTSALEVFVNDMLYINPRFTYFTSVLFSSCLGLGLEAPRDRITRSWSWSWNGVMIFEFSVLSRTVLIKLFVGDHNAYWLMCKIEGISVITLYSLHSAFTYLLFLCLYKRRQHKCKVVGASHKFSLRRASFQQQWSSDETTSCSHGWSVTEPAGFPYMQQACWIWLNLNSCKGRTVKFAMYRVSQRKWPVLYCQMFTGPFLWDTLYFWHFLWQDAWLVTF